MMQPEETNTRNDFLLGSNGRQLSPVFPVLIVTKQQAYRTAAWIKIMGEVLPNEDPPSTFEEVEKAIMNT